MFVFYKNPQLLLNTTFQKDPTKYWYVEKYVHGNLVETIEVELGTGTAFGKTSSRQNPTDTFYGWSLNQDSTSSSFNSTTTYKNTATKVKSSLDENKTLKIYAIFKYQEKTIGQTIETFKSTVTGADETETITFSVTALKDGDYSITASHKNITITSNGSGGYTSSSSDEKESWGYGGNYANTLKVAGKTQPGGFSPITGTIKSGEVIEGTGKFKYTSPTPTSSGTVQKTISVTYPGWVTTTKYRQ